MKRSPTWMVRRLLLMSPGEVLVRSMRAVRSVADRWRTRKRPVLACAGEFTGKEFPAGRPFFDLAA
ncbi:MAG: hypothetical protein KAJ12_05465, partial [Bacteroidetes bacterium]|nr:hypothetical protein [Bacteroidota bacterium]